MFVYDYDYDYVYGRLIIRNSDCGFGIWETKMGDGRWEIGGVRLTGVSGKRKAKRENG